MTKWLRACTALLLSCLLTAFAGEAGAQKSTKPEPAAKPNSKPSKPGDPPPENPKAARPSVVLPAKPGVPPSKPGAVPPTKPGAVTPTKPGVVTPSKPGVVPPATPGVVTPTKPGDGAPTTPDVVKPAPPVRKAIPRSARLRAKKFNSGRISFSLSYRGVESAYDTMSAFVMPGETLEISAKGGSGLYAASSHTAKIVADMKKPIWRWKIPARHGDHQIRIRDRAPGKTDAAVLNVFVQKPYDGGPTIGEYPIGQYQPPPLENASAFAPPAGFVEVTDANLATKVSPHFKLGQFVCKDGVKGRRYLALRPMLLLKLERVLEELAKRGFPADTLTVMSGFRTPVYNAGIGNETTSSRHLYGDAADVFLDRDDDGWMDDLDADGLITMLDAVVLRDLIEETIDAEARTGPFAGGLSAYEATGFHGPFVHIDTRGTRARW
jgi:hypothetical protein